MTQPRPTPPISVLMYHQVGKFKEPETHRSSYCEVDRFHAQMALLKFAGYQVISLEEAYSALFANVALPRRSVVLSFDDGYENFADNALPILAEFGYPSVLFAVSGLLGQPAQWLAGEREKPPLLSASRLRELRSAKVEIGSHTISHPRLGRLPPEQAWREIADSKSELEQVLGEPVKFFAYPYGDYNPDVRDAVERAGYQAALTCSRGLANTAPNAFEIPRKAISYGDSLIGFFWKLAVKNQRKDRYE
ncbi:MAG: polysaccharide deacetylase family protein [Candidatus Methylumidiphilus sp.]